MTTSSPYRLVIPAVVEGSERPLWSVMIPTYNCAGFLRESLASVLSQAPGPDLMQIEVVDDGSTQDDPEAIVQELGQGRVSFYRQPQNVGYIRNFETCLLRSRGHLVHILHGDDSVLPGFYQKLQTLFARHPDMGLVYCRHIFMDDRSQWQRISVLEQNHSGLLNQALERIVTRHPIQTPAVVVRRAVYEQLGGFDRRIQHSGEDWEMWCRIAAQYSVGYEIEPLALYRTHDKSLSGQSVRTGQDLENVRKAYQMVMTYLLPHQVATLGHRAAKFWALCGLNNALRFVENRDWRAVWAQVQAALKFDHSLHMLATFSVYLGVAVLKQLLFRQEDRHILPDDDQSSSNLSARPAATLSPVLQSQGEEHQ
ncbi:glycosyltransferase family 2 protein [Nodosilinea sp. E11]|uniref:glycosyltransferase family 2 protein n=1 Tax=Nodosilinea sp. E11 TaxID=3037479 RepID=UPI002934A699|nr:glycosyltransferase [Nodosilinea sp. E11]WOD39250.1 glycosyltransferase [Nodosilinea sp. E11]